MPSLHSGFCSCAYKFTYVTNFISECGAGFDDFSKFSYIGPPDLSWNCCIYLWSFCIWSTLSAFVPRSLLRARPTPCRCATPCYSFFRCFETASQFYLSWKLVAGLVAMGRTEEERLWKANPFDMLIFSSN